jgi:membrane protein
MDPRPPIPAGRLRRFVALVAGRVAQLQLTQTAASLAFLSVLAMVPVFSIAISLLGASPVFARPRDALLQFLSATLFLPGFSELVVRYLNQFASKAGQLSLIGGLFFFATAFTALLTVDRTLNRIWQVRRPRPLARRLTLYWTFLTLGPLLLALTLLANGLLLAQLFEKAGPLAVQRAWLSTLPWIASTMVLTLLYRLVPNAPVRWRDALLGGLVGAAALEGLKQALAFQAVKLPTYTVVYGAFAALPLILLWLFSVWLAVLAAAVVVACLPAWSHGVLPPAPHGPAARYARGRGVLLALLAAQRRGEAALQAGSLRTLFDQDAEAADETAALLAGLGYLRRHWLLGRDGADGDPAADEPVWQEWWLLAPQAGALCLRELFEHCWHGDESDRAVSAGAPGARARLLALAELDCRLDALPG